MDPDFVSMLECSMLVKRDNELVFLSPHLNNMKQWGKGMNILGAPHDVLPGV
jgi:hypothetical protein